MYQQTEKISSVLFWRQMAISLFLLEFKTLKINIKTNIFEFSQSGDRQPCGVHAVTSRVLHGSAPRLRHHWHKGERPCQGRRPAHPAHLHAQQIRCATQKINLTFPGFHFCAIPQMVLTSWLTTATRTMEQTRGSS